MFISGIEKMEGLSKYHVIEKKRSSAYAETHFKKKFKIGSQTFP